MNTYLDPNKTIETIETLYKRIDERFPSSGLAGVCKKLCVTASTTKERAEMIAAPNYMLRLLVGLVVFCATLILVYSISLMDIEIRDIGGAELVQVTEAAINDIVLIGAALFFLITVEIRVKRSRTLEALHELRTISHVIDMHQLTKDPSRLRANLVLTHSSPVDKMSAYELMRYLDYCSEMLSLTGKVAALYVQNFRDPLVLSSVNEIEHLTTSLSRKIWQKIMILHKLEQD